MRDRPVFRFAPSPTGALHLGHALSAFLNADAAAASGGRFLLRIENTDLARCTPQNEIAILDDLRLLGLIWEEPVRRQSEHFDLYGQALNRLRAKRLIYPAFLSRGAVQRIVAEAESGGAVWSRDPDGVALYPTDERTMADEMRRIRMDAGEPFAWRLDIDRALEALGGVPSWHEEGNGPAGETGLVRFDPRAWGDVLVARKDFPASYTLAVVVDDAEQRISTVIRGQDLFYATAVQRVLQELLGLPTPAYRHHRLILGPDGRKLSKTLRDTSLASLRDQGVSPREIRQMVGLAG